MRIKNILLIIKIMCETLSLDFVDIILSFIIFGLNIIYTVWGWLIPNNEEREGEAMSAAREELKEVIQKLQSGFFHIF